MTPYEPSNWWFPLNGSLGSCPKPGLGHSVLSTSKGRKLVLANQLELGYDHYNQKSKKPQTRAEGCALNKKRWIDRG